MIENRPQARLGPLAILYSLVFGFATWTALVIGMGGRACTLHYSFLAGVGWWETYTVFGAIYWVPTVIVAGGLAYLVARSGRLPRQTAALLLIAALSVIAILVSSALLTPPHGRCVYL